MASLVRAHQGESPPCTSRHGPALALALLSRSCARCWLKVPCIGEALAALGTDNALDSSSSTVDLRPEESLEAETDAGRAELDNGASDETEREGEEREQEASCGVFFDSGASSAVESFLMWP